MHNMIIMVKLLVLSYHRRLTLVTMQIKMRASNFTAITKVFAYKAFWPFSKEDAKHKLNTYLIAKAIDLRCCIFGHCYLGYPHPHVLGFCLRRPNF